ncbi:F-BAR and double SH3 domains protein 1 [Quaeritorhiza haematococci]|nr:F-BAR and double SH3 domains protein 1 [Quaeritorhiza haematococci]
MAGDKAEKGAENMHQYIKTLRVQQQNQLAKLQLKAEADLELMDNLREFMKSLDKLAKSFTQKKFRRASAAANKDDKESDGISGRATYLTFNTIITETEKVAKQRGMIAEKIAAEIAEVAKDYNKEKQTINKKNKYQQELHSSYEWLDKSKLAYDKAAKESESFKKKYDDALRKPNSGLNALRNIVGDSEERVEKLRSKWKNSEHKLAHMRNEYVLAVRSVNVQQTLYWNEDLPQYMKKIDGIFYKVFAGMLGLYTKLEGDFVSALRAGVDYLTGCVGKIDRETDSAAFIREHQSIFVNPRPFSFEGSSNDTQDTIVVTDVTKVVLGTKMALLMSRADELTAGLDRKEKEIAGLKQMVDVYSQTPSFGNANSPTEQIIDNENEFGLLRIERTKLVAQLEVLKAAGVQPMKPAVNAAPSPTAVSSVKTAVALYDHVAQDSTQTSLRESEEVMVVGSEEDGWIKVRTQAGEGLVPVTYIKVKEPMPMQQRPSVTGGGPPPMPSRLNTTVSTLNRSKDTQQVRAVYDYDASDVSELSFKAGDMIEVIDITEVSADAWWEGRHVRTGKTGTFSVVFVEGWEAITAGGRGGGSTVTSPTASIRASPKPARSSVVAKAKALYAYDPTCEGELQLLPGDIITVINKNTGSNAWWEGESIRGRGQFPVNYVESIDNDDTMSVASSSVASMMSSLASSAVNARRTSTVSSIAISNNRAAMGVRAKAIYDYTAQTPEELSFREDDIIQITDSSDNDWWEGKLNGRSGLVPATYVERI